MPESIATHSKGIGDYNRTLCLCFLSSLAVCLAFLPVIPLSDRMGSNATVIIFSAVRALLSVLILYVVLAVVHLSWNRKKYHRTQTIFWPTRCQHCALVLKSKKRTVAPVPGSSHDHLEQIRDTQTSPRDNLMNGSPTQSTRTGETTEISRLVSYFVDRNPSVQPNYGSVRWTEGATPVSSSQNNSSVDQAEENTSVVFAHACTRRNRSLVNVFIVFSLISLLGIPLQLIGDIMCTLHSTRPLVTVLIAEAQAIALLAMFPISMKFAWDYYDAVFVTTRHNACFIIVSLSAAIWVSTIKFIDPISSVLHFDTQPDTPHCNLTGKLGQFLEYGKAVATPFYTECAVIAAGILWEVWISLIPGCPSDTTIQIPEDFIAFPAQDPPSLLHRTISRLKSQVNHTFKRCEGTSGESQHLLGGACTELETCLRRTWILSAVQSMAYFATSLYFVKAYEKDRKSFDLYITWCIEILFVFPFLMLYMHLSYVTKPPRASDVPSLDQRRPYLLLKKTKTESHDVLLLFCSCGIFCLSIFRMAAAVGLLCGHMDDDSDSLALYIFAIAYSVVIMMAIWYMTTFLLRVQRQLRRVRDPLETKWTMVLLVNIIVTNGLQWLIESVVIVESPLPTKYFAGQTGEVMAILLEPFATLYGLHAAMIAYETYRVLFQKAFSEPRGPFDISTMIPDH